MKSQTSHQIMMDLRTQTLEKTLSLFNQDLSKKNQQPLNLSILLRSETDKDSSRSLNVKNCLFARKGDSASTQASSPEQENLDISEDYAEEVHSAEEGYESPQNSFSEVQTPNEILGKRGYCTRSKSRNVPDISLQTKGGQNEMKNHQGTIALKVTKECQKIEGTEEDTELFKQATSSLTPEKREDFRKWASKLSNLKTWKTLSEWLRKDLEFGIIFVEMVDLFLSSSGIFQAKYEEWLDNQKRMTKATKTTLRDQGNKEFYRKKFLAIIDDIFDFMADESNEVINKSRKYLKTV